MQKLFIAFIAILTFFMSNLTQAFTEETYRVPQFSNEKVNVWQTTIYPGPSQELKMHRHEYNRVLVAFDDGLLKIKNDKGKIHYLKLSTNQSYYLKKDVSGELHTDENTSNHPIKMLVIELKG